MREKVSLYVQTLTMRLSNQKKNDDQREGAGEVVGGEITKFALGITRHNK